MPIFEFKCLECGEIFERLFLGSNDQVDLSCPKCKAENCHRVVSAANYSMARGAGDPKPKLTTKSCGGNQCMTLDLPGPTR
jgi:putative FmdB family regulatory protein